MVLILNFKVSFSLFVSHTLNDFYSLFLSAPFVTGNQTDETSVIMSLDLFIFSFSFHFLFKHGPLDTEHSLSHFALELSFLLTRKSLPLEQLSAATFWFLAAKAGQQVKRDGFSVGSSEPVRCCQLPFLQLLSNSSKRSFLCIFIPFLQNHI